MSHRTQQPVPPLSVVVTTIVLFSGLWTAITRPSEESVLAGCLMVAFAGLLVFSFKVSNLPQSTPGSTFVVLPALVEFRIVNVVLMGPLAVHFTARFPIHDGTVESKTSPRCKKGFRQNSFYFLIDDLRT